MGNSINEYNLDNFIFAFEKVIVPLDYLARANYHSKNTYFFYSEKKYYDIYGKMT